MKVYIRWKRFEIVVYGGYKCFQILKTRKYYVFHPFYHITLRETLHAGIENHVLRLRLAVSKPWDWLETHLASSPNIETRASGEKFLGVVNFYQNTVLATAKKFLTVFRILRRKLRLEDTVSS